MEFFNKAKWVLGIIIIFVLVAATNIIDRENFSRVRDSVVSIYEDRLVANDLIFEILKSVQEKEIAAVTSDSVFYLEKNRMINTEMKSFIKRYELTKLTPEEEELFDEYKSNYEQLISAELALVKSNFTEKKQLLSAVSKVKKNLYALSKIQLTEGSKQMSISENALNTIDLFTTIEINILIFLAILIQIIVIYNPKKKQDFNKTDK